MDGHIRYQGAGDIILGWLDMWPMAQVPLQPFSIPTCIEDSLSLNSR